MEKLSKPLAIKIFAILLVATTSFVGGYAFSQHDSSRAETTTSPTLASPATTSHNQWTGTADFADVAAQQGPAVVNISVSGKVKTGRPLIQGFPGLDPTDPFADFFHRFQVPIEPGDSPAHALGSGFIIDPDGLVLTNAHVLTNAEEVIVKLADKREFKAKLLGSDKLSDVALLKIDAHNLPSVRIGDPQRVRVGEWVLAIGSPFGMENTVTAGIVSAKSRTLPDEGYVPFLQTDVPINPGNSGGPLFNMSGEVIGINSQIYSRTGGYQGLSFAIPIDVAMKVERQLADHGKVRRGRLGIGIEPVSAELAQSLGLPKPAGALVGSVERDSPADKAGLEPGDVVLRFNDHPINDAKELPALVADLAPGTQAKVRVWHQGRENDLPITLGKLQTSEDDDAANAVPAGGKLGLAVRPLTPQERNEARVAAGLIVDAVNPGAAQRAGVRPGDLIIAANGEMLTSVAQLKAQSAKSGHTMPLLIQRGNERLLIALRLG